MIFQTAMGKSNEVVYRSVVSALTKTTVLTDASANLGVGAPVILATETASANGYYIKAALSATNPINNLYIGNLHWGLGVNSAYLGGEDAGLVQCYGYDSDGLLASGTDAIGAGVLCQPNLGYLSTTEILGGSAATGNASHVAAIGLAGLAVLASIPATATATRATGMFLRCM